MLYSYNNFAGLDGNEAVSSDYEIVESVEAPRTSTPLWCTSEPSASFLSVNIDSILPGRAMTTRRPTLLAPAPSSL